MGERKGIGRRREERERKGWREIVHEGEEGWERGGRNELGPILLYMYLRREKGIRGSSGRRRKERI